MALRVEDCALVGDCHTAGRWGAELGLPLLLAPRCHPDDVRLLAEEYDPQARRLLGNFPQAFSHVGLIHTALNLSRPSAGPTEHRKEA